jgi:hypothetical protein
MCQGKGKGKVSLQWEWSQRGHEFFPKRQWLQLRNRVAASGYKHLYASKSKSSALTLSSKHRINMGSLLELLELSPQPYLDLQHHRKSAPCLRCGLMACFRACICQSPIRKMVLVSTGSRLSTTAFLWIIFNLYRCHQCCALPDSQQWEEHLTFDHVIHRALPLSALH